MPPLHSQSRSHSRSSAVPCMQIELSAAPHIASYTIIYHIIYISLLIIYLSRDFLDISAHSCMVVFFFILKDLLRVTKIVFLFDIYPTYLGRTQQPPVRVAGRRDPTMASAYPAAAVHAVPNDADVVRHSCADVVPNHRIWENPPPLRLPLNAAPRWCCLCCFRGVCWVKIARNGIRWEIVWREIERDPVRNGY